MKVVYDSAREREAGSNNATGRWFERRKGTRPGAQKAPTRAKVQAPSGATQFSSKGRKWNMSRSSLRNNVDKVASFFSSSVSSDGA